MKIGKSCHPEKRLNQLQTGSSVKLKLLGTFDLPDSWERRLHGILSRSGFKKRGEWYNLNLGETQWLLDYLQKTLLQTDIF